MQQERIVLITGGCRSGKSEYAERLALAYEGPVYYLATGVVTDVEMKERVEQHQKRRPAHWHTIEEPCQLEKVVGILEKQQGTILLDSLSGWMTNLLYEGGWKNWQWDRSKEERALATVKAFLAQLQASSLRFLIVSDEVGMGLVPSTPEGRAFRDLNGRANQLVAASADAVYLIVAGLPLKIK